MKMNQRILIKEGYMPNDNNVGYIEANLELINKLEYLNISPVFELLPNGEKKILYISLIPEPRVKNEQTRKN